VLVGIAFDYLRFKIQNLDMSGKKSFNSVQELVDYIEHEAQARVTEIEAKC